MVQQLFILVVSLNTKTGRQQHIIRQSVRAIDAFLQIAILKPKLNPHQTSKSPCSDESLGACLFTPIQIFILL